MTHLRLSQNTWRRRLNWILTKTSAILRCLSGCRLSVANIMARCVFDACGWMILALFLHCTGFWMAWISKSLTCLSNQTLLFKYVFMCAAIGYVCLSTVLLSLCFLYFVDESVFINQVCCYFYTCIFGYFCSMTYAISCNKLPYFCYVNPFSVSIFFSARGVNVIKVCLPWTTPLVSTVYICNTHVDFLLTKGFQAARD